MYQCSWLTNGAQCQNKTDYLVCDICKAEKDYLYKLYKEKEKTIISALSSEPRGDLLEVSKVLGRLSTIVELRQEFTRRLCYQVHDFGHKYHIANLLEVMNKYRYYLKDLIRETVENAEEETPAPIQKIICESKSFDKQLDNTIEIDPFIEFDHVAKDYKRKRQERIDFVESIMNEYGITESDVVLLIAFHNYIGWYMHEFPKLLTHFAKGRLFSRAFIPLDYELNERDDAVIKFMKDREPEVRESVDWVVKYGRNKCKFYIMPHDGNVIMLIKSGSIVYPHIKKFTMNLIDKGEYWVGLEELIGVNIESILSKLRSGRHIGVRQKYLTKVN